jgi:sec-independent protein translocase protein TatC
VNEWDDDDDDGQSRSEIEDFRMPLLEHLRELRDRMIRMMIALGLGLIVGMVVAKDVINLLMAPIRKVLPGADGPNRMDLFYDWLTEPLIYLPGWGYLLNGEATGSLAVISSLEGVYTWLRAALVTGVLLSLPYLSYQIWRFVAPGLYKTERRMVLPLSLASTLLFLFGITFAYILIIPMAFGFFLTFLDEQVTLSIEDATSTVVRIMVAFGLCYQLPVVVWFLARIGLIDHRDMIKFFRYAIVAIFVIAALVTPPDIITQFFLGVPLIGLYLGSIVVAWMSTTKVRDLELEAEMAADAALAKSSQGWLFRKK